MSIECLQLELKRLKTDGFIARKIISKCERRLFWRERALDEYNTSWGAMSAENRRVAAASTQEHVIDPEIMDAIKAEARATSPGGDPRSAITRAAIAKTAASAQAAAQAAAAAPTQAPAPAAPAAAAQDRRPAAPRRV
jgi:hypothetical protein